MSEEIIAYRVGDHFLCPKHYQMSVKILSVHDIELPAQPVKEGEVENCVCRQCEDIAEERDAATPLPQKKMIEPRRKTLSKREKINLLTLEDILADSGDKLSFVSDFFVPQSRDSLPEFSNDGFSGLLIILDEIKDDIDFVLNGISERRRKGLIIEKTE